MTIRKTSIECHDREAFENFQNEYGKAVSDALAYLTQWALFAYDTVSISWNPRDKEFLAIYTQECDTETSVAKQSFVIGGVWHEQDRRYSFHS